MRQPLPMEDQIADQFVDAPDDFPFYDCVETEHSTYVSDHASDEASSVLLSPTSSSLRRRSISQIGESSVVPYRRGIDKEFDFSDSCDNSTKITQSLHSRLSYKARKYRLNRELKEKEKTSETLNFTSKGDESWLADSTGDNNEKSTLTTTFDERVGDLVNSGVKVEPSSSNPLLFIAGLVIKAIWFQINLLINFFTFPLWASYCFLSFVVDPFGTTRRGIGYIIASLVNLWDLLWELASRVMGEWIKDDKSMWKLFVRFLWGLFWSAYVSVALFSLLVLSVVISGFLVKNLVEEPIEIKENLNFDYTKNSPMALVPIWSCASVDCGVNCKESINSVKSTVSRVIPANHKLQTVISLNIPESDYNRNLGIFQVRVEFISANGETLASSSHPCMLKFKSEPIRLMLTFLKLVPLVAGYIIESQSLDLKIRGYTEADVPTACLKVTLEQRAEYKLGAGIPEVYDASLTLQSQLPLFKRILWMWKATIFIWSCIMWFMMELLFTLVCCRTLIIPRPRRSGVSFTYRDHRSHQELNESR